MSRHKATFTVDKDVVEELREVSRLTAIPQAQIVERALKRTLREAREDIEQGRAQRMFRPYPSK